MKDFFIGITHNRIFFITVAAWLIAQSIKVILGAIRERRFNFKWFLGTGGMPSSHVAGVAALATSIGLHLGFDSSIFAVTVVFTIIVMFDAQGVRQATGKQAEILNKMMEDIYLKKHVEEDRLKELIGHTPVQVLTGAFIGILIAVLFN
ncbi:MAG: divergent PAP2 family protein [Candidatus Omnitrophota bacterium]